VRLAPTLAIAAALVAGQAAAEAPHDWAPIVEDGQHRVLVDRANVVVDDAGYRLSTVLDIRHAPTHDDELGGDYSGLSAVRADDCAHNTSALVSYAYLDAAGHLLKRVDVPRAKWKFEDNGHGTPSARVAETVCPPPAPAAPPPPPPEPLTLSPNDGHWVRLPAADQTYALAYYRADSLTALGPGRVSLITKRVFASDTHTPAGLAYRVEIGAIAIDCAALRYASLDAALVNGLGEQVSVSRADIDEVAFYAIHPDSVADQLRKLACATPAARQAAQPPTPAATEPEFSSGTGWMTVKGYIVTASHVIAGADKLELYQGGKLVGVAEVITDDPANDVAVLRPRLTRAARQVAIPLERTPAALGAPIFTLGFPAPDVMGVSLKMTSGEVSATTGLDVASQRPDDLRLMQVSIPVQSGNSGGPVIAGDGRAVGIVISKLSRTSDDEVAQNVNYALKISYVRGLLAELPDIGGWRLPAPAGKSRADLVAALQGGVFLIIAVSPPGTHAREEGDTARR
jgi:hypothetical protein